MSLGHILFVRRPKSHRTFDSTCTRCFLIITANRQADLDQAEQDHVCDPWLLEQWTQMFEHHPPVRKGEKVYR